MMKHLHSGLTALIIGFAAATATHAGVEKEDTESELARAYAESSYQQGDVAGAIKGLEAQLARFPTDTETRGALAVLQGKQGDWKAAEAGFGLAADGATTPEGRAKWLYAQAEAADKSGNAPRGLDLRQAANAAVKKTPVESEAKGGPLNLTATARTGYDSNVLLASDGIVSAGSVSGQTSPLVGADVGVSRAKTIDIGELTWSGGAAVNWYTGSKASQYGMIATSAGASLKRANDTLGLDTSMVFLNTSGVAFYSFTVGGDWSRPVSKTPYGALSIALRANAQDFTNPTTTALNRDGIVIGGGPKLETSLSAGQTLQNELKLDRAFVDGAEYEALILGLQSTWTKSLGKADRVLAGMKVDRTGYVFHPQSRLDYALTLAPAWTRSFDPHTRAFLGYVFSINRSNLSDASYTKHMFLLQVTRDIL